MGFMSWERFRCQIHCDKYPDDCIHESLYMSMADALVDGGYAEYGYIRVHIDDCWSAGRDENGELRADPDRFPSGIQALAEYMHDRGLQLGIYGDAGPKTCAGYEGTLGHEDVDAATFAKWGVDYVKLDGCHLEEQELKTAYTNFGLALKKVASIQPMIYSCSWPAYITQNNGGNESAVPFETMYQDAGCNTWRNWHDIDNRWESLKSIVMHWADYWKVLKSIPSGSFNDADMLLVGDDHYGSMLSMDQARLQLGFWALIASPLLIGGDVRKITPGYRDILLNRYILNINQDSARNQPDCLAGCKDALVDTESFTSTSEEIQVWRRQLNGKDVQNYAFGFFNLGSNEIASRTTYSFLLKSVPLAIHCSDVWSLDPWKTVCPEIILDNEGSFNESLELVFQPEFWREAKKRRRETRMSTSANKDSDNWDIRLLHDGGDKHVLLQITALNVQPTSHRLVRISFRDEDSSKGEQ